MAPYEKAMLNEMSNICEHECDCFEDDCDCELIDFYDSDERGFAAFCSSSILPEYCDKRSNLGFLF